jgi:hypothetical protein
VSASLAVLLALPTTNAAVAASRFGGSTDDSVCDVGNTDRRVQGVMSPQAFIKQSCKNGQLLVGNSVVPLGSSAPEIVELAQTYCRIADIQSRRSRANMAGIDMEYEEVRCRLEKLKPQP